MALGIAEPAALTPAFRTAAPVAVAVVVVAGTEAPLAALAERPTIVVVLAAPVVSVAVSVFVFT
ncbi:MAG: hypothetical protein ACREEW_18765 [Caulobacteraceae bacterium]